ncbi:MULTISPECIES: hypothetical protein [unclassified Novosphingobium]|uniref:hypothetical protein n=1 Tax=unclassified Novosphingobium TaxID=2644732 RepID=UPI0025E1116B|nr:MULTISPECIES: hypothetical protein [unclassified Novosphingobium]HQS70219.1 hypothetical protein [Novosphingobium sp.]
MEKHGNQTHVTTEDARGGETSNVMRWVLAVGLFLAIGALTVIWVTGALVTPQ